MSELRELIAKFNNKTELIIDCLEKEEYDRLEILLNDRQRIIDIINSLSFPNSEFYYFCNEYNISNLQNKCNELFKVKMFQTREELKKISLSKSVSKQYYQENYVESIYFNKKI